MTVSVIVRIVSEHKYIKIYKYIYKYTIHTLLKTFSGCTANWTHIHAHTQLQILAQ